MTTILLHQIEQTEDEVEAVDTWITEIIKRINFMILKEEEGDKANKIQPLIDQETSLMLSAIGATGMVITNMNVELIYPKTMGKIQILQKMRKKYPC